MTEQKTIWKDEVHLYLGKELTGQNKPGAEKEWKKYKLRFDVGRDFPFTIDAWGNLGERETKLGKSLNLKELEEGNYYQITYTVEKEAFEAHGKKHDRRNVVFMSCSDEDGWKQSTIKREEEFNSRNVSTSTDSNQPTTSSSLPSLTPSEVVEFFDQYSEKREGAYDAYHATLTFLLNKFGREGFGAIIASAYNLVGNEIKRRLEESNESSGRSEVSSVQESADDKGESTFME